ncbi:MAG: DUF1990 domain-containing protein [Myxococcota bacterium]
MFSWTCTAAIPAQPPIPIAYNPILDTGMDLPFTLVRPSPATIQALLERSAHQPFTYSEVGLSAQGYTPPGYTVNARSAVIGRGPRDFQVAREAMQRWSMFRIGWADICWSDAPIAVDTVVAVLANRFGLWSINPCRVVYTIDDTLDEPHGSRQRFGFGYGTLPGHLLVGEERFLIDWNHNTDEITYSIHAFARASNPLVTAIRPAIVCFQRQFARASMKAMTHAIHP